MPWFRRGIIWLYLRYCIAPSQPELTHQQKISQQMRQMNALLATMPDDMRMLRIYTIPPDRIRRKPQRLVLGYWADGGFNITHDPNAEEQMAEEDV